MVSIATDQWKLDGINGVLFDKDGTLIDSHVYWGRIIERRVKAIIKYYSLQDILFSDLCLTMGYSLAKKKLVPEGPIALVSREEVIEILNCYLASMGVNSSEEVISGIFVKEHEAFMDEIFDYIKILPGVVEFLAHLKKHAVKTAVVTTDVIKNTHETLRYLKIDSFFDAVLGKESFSEPKVTGIPAIEALRLLGLKQEEAVCIGDAPMDLIMAKKGGLKAGIGVVTGQIEHHVLEQYSPYITSSMRDLRIN